MGHNQSVRRPHDAAFDHGSSLFQCLHIACSIERGTCIKGLKIAFQQFLLIGLLEE